MYPYISKCLPPPKWNHKSISWFRFVVTCTILTRLHQVYLNVLNINFKRTGIHHSNILILHNNPILISHLWLSKWLAKILCIAYINSWGKQCFKFATTFWKFLLFKLISPYNTMEVCHWHCWLPSLQSFTQLLPRLKCQIFGFPALLQPGLEYLRMNIWCRTSIRGLLA